jgi:ribosome maturation factor RimP
MTESVITEIFKIATSIAEKLGLEVVKIVFQTNKNPNVLRVDIRNLNGDTSLDDCEQMSKSLEQSLDTEEILPGAYLLEISSPGISEQLTTDREFISFKGFPVMVETSEPYKKKQKWQGNLQGRDEQSIYINQKGKMISIPRELVSLVQLENQ